MEQGWTYKGAQPVTGESVIRPTEATAPTPNAADGMGTHSSADGWQNVDHLSGAVDGHDWAVQHGGFESEEGWEQV
jgi:hypothetical protein